MHKAAGRGQLDVVMVRRGAAIVKRVTRVLQVLDQAGASKTIRDKDRNRSEDVVCEQADPPCRRKIRAAIVELVTA